MSDEQPIIVIKKKGGHGGHHGGAWKVAYADFVTAMMSLFIVLWLMNTSKPVEEAVAGYFRDPLGTASKKGTAMAGAGDGTPVIKKEDLGKLKNDLMKMLEKLPGFEKVKNQIKMTITPEGLRIEFMENPNGTFFENGKAQPTPIMQNLLKTLSAEVGKLPNTVSIEGHTDSTPFSGATAYGNWELSTDRANASRRLMQENGIRPNQVAQVRGYADQSLLKPQQPNDASNRRVTMIIHYVGNQPQLPGYTSNGPLPTGVDLNPDAPKPAGTKPDSAKPDGKTNGEKPTAGTASTAAKPAPGKPSTATKEATPEK
jgi:chemotaxis protein MotB